MINTTNLNLVKPDIDAEAHQTIVDLANNFQKLDDVTEIYGNGMPISGDWTVPRRRWELAPVVGEYAGWITIRSGKAAPIWQSRHLYYVDDLIVPVNNNGHIYRCFQRGISGLAEPTFPTTSAGIIEDVKGATTWQASRSYVANSIIKPSLSNDRYYISTASGVSNTVEPTWLATEGSVTYDNGIQWTCHVIAKWQEIGVSALFKRFGLIEG